MVCIDILLNLLYNLFLKWVRLYVCPLSISMFILLIYNAHLHFLWKTFCPLFSSFLSRLDVQIHACRTVTPSPAVGNLLHLAHIVHACHFLIAADSIIPLSRVHVFHPDFLLKRCAMHWSIRCDIFTQTVTYIGHRTCAPCICTVGSSVGAYSSKFCWHAYHTSLLLWWHLFYCHAAHGLFETRFSFRMLFGQQHQLTAPHFVKFFRHPLPLVGSNRFHPWFPFYIGCACMLHIFVILLSFIVISTDS